MLVLLGIALSAATALQAQRIPTRHATLSLRLGGVDAPQYAAFPRPPDVVVDSSGALYVRVGSPPAIEVFGPDGKHVRTIGRGGEGPGEFRVAARHGLLGDTLWVINFPVPRLSRFLVDGTHLETTRLDVIDHGRPFTGAQSITALLRDGGAIAVPTASPINAGGRTEVPVYVGDRALQERSVVTAVTMPRGMHIPEVGSFALVPFPRPPLISVARNGIGFVIVTWDQSPDVPARVVRHNAAGTILWSAALELPRAPVPTNMLDSLIHRGAEMAAGPLQRARRMGRGPSGDLEDVVKDALDAPDFMPPVSVVKLGGDGSVWLHLGNDEWLILDAEGRTTFQASLPPAINVTDVSLDHVWGTVVGDFDVPYVVRFDLSR